MIKDLCKILLVMVLISLFLGFAIAFLQYIAFIIMNLGYDVQGITGMWGGMLSMLTLQWLERRLK